ncbi:YqcI/YcgG family protein [Streptomyces sp. DW26H14]|uniref:YqcI/YcgG family protein n=1 Tax=Streptomyces sp. DW26H14 TaxID=3435395 RepID=UPI00403E0868
MHTSTEGPDRPLDSRTAQSLEDCVIGDVPAWGLPVAHDLVTTLLSQESPFPCSFAVAAAKKHSLRFGFVESARDEGTWGPLVDILRAYLDCYQELGRDTSLVVFFQPDEQQESLQDYFTRFWSVLQFLHEKDPEPWPAQTPTDPEDTWWEFSFGGTEIFVVCNTPAHVTRLSRHSPGFMITFQPRWVFDGLEPDSPRGAKAREVIRNRIRRYDGMEPARELGNYGDPANREWRQYFLPDTPQEQMTRCPFHAARQRGADGSEPADGPTAPPLAEEIG